MNVLDMTFKIARSMDVTKWKGCWTYHQEVLRSIYIYECLTNVIFHNTLGHLIAMGTWCTDSRFDQWLWDALKSSFKNMHSHGYRDSPAYKHLSKCTFNVTPI